MSGGLEAAADVATGAIWGHAVGSPASGVAHDGAGGLCLNCGTQRIGDYCHACGQSGHIHRSFGAIWHDLAHGAFHFEGRMWRTLPMLVLRPGELTRRYVRGERARFVSPLALYLFIMFFAFALLTVVGAHLQAPDIAPETRSRAVASFDKGSVQNLGVYARLQQKRAAAIAAGKPVAAIDAQIDQNRREQHTLAALQSAVEAPDLKGFDIHTGWHRLDEGLETAKANPNLLLYKLQSNAYKYSWALIPLSVPFLWILFPFSRRFHAYDHAVFVTYSLSFMLMLVVVLSVLGAIGVGSALLFTLALLVPPIHIYSQLRGAYGCSRPKAAIRMLILLVCSQVVLGLFILLLIALGLLG